MNKLEYYQRQKEPWGEKELTELKNEYEGKKMNISEIADIHRRTPGSISYRLKSIGIITDNTQSRGYIEYKNSDLYKEIIKNGRITDAKLKKESSSSISAEIGMLRNDISSFKEIIELRGEVNSLKKEVKEILRLMSLVYEFISSPVKLPF